MAGQQHNLLLSTDPLASFTGLLSRLPTSGKQPSSNQNPWAVVPGSVLRIPHSSLSFVKAVGSSDSFYLTFKATYQDRTVNCKVLLDKNTDKASPEALTAESNAVAVLIAGDIASWCHIKHSNLVEFIGICKIPPIIVTKWYPRGTVSNLITAASQSPDGPARLTWAKRLVLAQGVARAVLAVHQSGVIHDNISSNHVMVDADWSAKLDRPVRRVSVATASMSQSREKQHQVRWMAPEQFAEDLSSFASDAYSFGVFMYELLTWRSPFGKSRSDITIVRYVMQGKRPEVPAFAELPGANTIAQSQFAAYQNLMTRAWHQEPSTRPDFNEIVRVLDTLVSDSGTSQNIAAAIQPVAAHPAPSNTQTVRLPSDAATDGWGSGSLPSFGAERGFFSKNVNSVTDTWLARKREGLGDAIYLATASLASPGRADEWANDPEYKDAAAGDKLGKIDEESQGRNELMTYGQAHGIKLAEDTLHAAHNPGLRSAILVYHAFFVFAVVINAVFMVLTTFQILPEWKPLPSYMDKGACGLTNVSFAILMRTELFLQGLYWLTCKIGRASSSHSVKYWLARFLYHAPGGLHAGCGVAGFAWLFVYVCTEWLSNYDGPGWTDVPAGQATSITGIFIFIILFFICLFAYAPLRGKYHNLFELSHRYLGWLLVPMVWTHVLVKASYYSRYNVYGEERSQERSYSSTTLERPNFWNILIQTILIFHPWFFVRRRKVKTTVPQKSLIIIDGFPGYGVAGHWGRLSVNWTGQWHPFAVVSGKKTAEKEQNHSMLIARAGDWTQARIKEGASDEPRSHFYVRLIRAPGFMYTTRMWKRIICVASGAGIAPVLPVLMQGTAESVYVVWITSQPQTFGPVMSLLEQYPGQYWVHDTKTQGRPDVVALTIKAVLKNDAEAVYIVANQELTYSVVRGCFAVDIKAFGAIWDS